MKQNSGETFHLFDRPWLMWLLVFLPLFLHLALCVFNFPITDGFFSRPVFTDDLGYEFPVALQGRSLFLENGYPWGYYPYHAGTVLTPFYPPSSFSYILLMSVLNFLPPVAVFNGQLLAIVLLFPFAFLVLLRSQGIKLWVQALTLFFVVYVLWTGILSVSLFAGMVGFVLAHALILLMVYGLDFSQKMNPENKWLQVIGIALFVLFSFFSYLAVGVFAIFYLVLILLIRWRQTYLFTKSVHLLTLVLLFVLCAVLYFLSGLEPLVNDHGLVHNDVSHVILPNFLQPINFLFYLPDLFALGMVTCLLIKEHWRRDPIFLTMITMAAYFWLASIIRLINFEPLMGLIVFHEYRIGTLLLIVSIPFLADFLSRKRLSRLHMRAVLIFFIVLCFFFVGKLSIFAGVLRSQDHFFSMPIFENSYSSRFEKIQSTIAKFGNQTRTMIEYPSSTGLWFQDHLEYHLLLITGHEIMMTQRAMVHTGHHHATLDSGILAGKPIGHYSESELRRFFNDYNIGQLFVIEETSKSVVESFPALFHYRESLDSFEIYDVMIEANFLADGHGRVEVDTTGIWIHDLTTNSDSVVLKYHWSESLSSPIPGVRLTRFPVPWDSVGLIEIHNPQPETRIHFGGLQELLD